MGRFLLLERDFVVGEFQTSCKFNVLKFRIQNMFAELIDVFMFAYELLSYHFFKGIFYLKFDYLDGFASMMERQKLEKD